MRSVPPTAMPTINPRDKDTGAVVNTLIYYNTPSVSKWEKIGSGIGLPPTLILAMHECMDIIWVYINLLAIIIAYLLITVSCEVRDELPIYIYVYFPHWQTLH